MIKKNILTVTTILSLALIGCGSDDTTDPFEDKVTFKSAGAYNMMDYIAGETTKSYNYVVKDYEDEKGDKKYPDPQESDSTTIYTLNGQTVNVIEDSFLDRTLTPSTDRITFVDVADDGNTTMLQSKFADKGDQILNFAQTQDNIKNNIVCKVTQHLDTKEVRGKSYSDVLEVTCQYKVEFQGTGNTQGINKIMTGNDTSFYAKLIGLISSKNESCTETIVNNNKTKQCEKQLLDISTIN